MQEILILFIAVFVAAVILFIIKRQKADPQAPAEVKNEAEVEITSKFEPLTPEAIGAHVEPVKEVAPAEAVSEVGGSVAISAHVEPVKEMAPAEAVSEVGGSVAPPAKRVTKRATKRSAGGGRNRGASRKS